MSVTDNGISLPSESSDSLVDVNGRLNPITIPNEIICCVADRHRPRIVLPLSYRPTKEVESLGQMYERDTLRYTG